MSSKKHNKSKDLLSTGYSNAYLLTRQDPTSVILCKSCKLFQGWTSLLLCAHYVRIIRCIFEDKEVFSVLRMICTKRTIAQTHYPESMASYVNMTAGIRE